jgi:hypothetical protein
MKSGLFQNVDICDLGIGGYYGLSDSLVFENCRITAPTYVEGILDGTKIESIDGVTVTYSNGKITIPKAHAADGWGCVPGQHVGLVGPNFNSRDSFTADWGFGVVLSVTEDSSNVYIMTTLPYAALPAWSPATNNIRFFGNMNVEFRNCWGSDRIRSYSEAYEAGQRYFEYRRIVVGGQYNSYGAYSFGDIAGELVSMSAKVIQPGSDSSLFIKFQFATMDPASSMAVDGGGGVEVKFNIGVSGYRNFTQSALTGKTGTDDVLLNGVSQSAVPVRLINGQWNIYDSSDPASGFNAPLAEIIIITDCGQTRKAVPMSTMRGTNTTVFGVQGLLS